MLQGTVGGGSILRTIFIQHIEALQTFNSQNNKKKIFLKKEKKWKVSPDSELL